MGTIVEQLGAHLSETEVVTKLFAIKIIYYVFLSFVYFFEAGSLINLGISVFIDIFKRDCRTSAYFTF